MYVAPYLATCACSAPPWASCAGSEAFCWNLRNQKFPAQPKGMDPKSQDSVPTICCTHPVFALRVHKRSGTQWLSLAWMQKRMEVSSPSRGSRAQPSCPFDSCPHLPTCSQPDLQGLRFWGKLFQDQPSLCTCRKRSRRFPIQIVMALVMDADEQRVKKLKLSQSFPLESVWILVLIRNYEVQSVFWTASNVLLRMDSPCSGLLFVPSLAFGSVYISSSPAALLLHGSGRDHLNSFIVNDWHQRCFRKLMSASSWLYFKGFTLWIFHGVLFTLEKNCSTEILPFKTIQ